MPFYRTDRLTVKLGARAAELEVEMAGRRTALLFCPPHPPVEIPAGRRVSVGRGAACQLSIPRDDVSRRHCEVWRDGESFRVRDLGSTNGTYVNGQRIEEERALDPGDRLEVGSSLLTCCWLEGPVGDLGERDSDATRTTVVRERSPARDVLRGDLEEIPTFVVLQMLEVGRKTGVLTIESEPGGGRIWLAGGSPVHAETEKKAGLEAALELVGCERGRFSFEPGARAPERTISAGITEILIEGSRLADEADR